jgi:hypothetical protein
MKARQWSFPGYLYPLAYAPACIAALQADTQPLIINYAVKPSIVKCEYCNDAEFISFSHATPTQNAVKMYKNAFFGKLLCYIYFPYIKCAWLCCDPDAPEWPFLSVEELTREESNVGCRHYKDFSWKYGENEKEL